MPPAQVIISKADPLWVLGHERMGAESLGDCEAHTRPVAIRGTRFIIQLTCLGICEDAYLSPWPANLISIRQCTFNVSSCNAGPASVSSSLNQNQW